MAVRLNKALKELNVGISAVGNFLIQAGLPLQDATPNAKITDEQYMLLLKKFGENKKFDAETQADIQKRKERERKEKEERRAMQRVTQNDDSKQVFKIIGNLQDLQKKENAQNENGYLLIEPKIEVHFAEDADANRRLLNSNGWHNLREDILFAFTDCVALIQKVQSSDYILSWPKSVFFRLAKREEGAARIRINDSIFHLAKKIPVAPYVVNEQNNTSTPSNDNNAVTSPINSRNTGSGRLIADKDGVYRLTAPQEQSLQVKNVGFIDLSSLNSKTRPNRKSKSERMQEKKERKEQKKKEKIESLSPEKTKAAIRDIWQKHIDIRERMIKRMCTPIYINKENSFVRGGKLEVEIDESRFREEIDSILTKRLKCSECHLEEGFVLIDEANWDFSEDELDSIRRDLARNFVEIDTTPAINVSIDYYNGKNSFDNLTMEEIVRLDKELKDGKILEGRIDDKIACIAKVNIDYDKYLNYLFGSHYERIIKYNKDTNEIKKERINITFTNEYINLEKLERYSKTIGLKVSYFQIAFKVLNKNADAELYSIYGDSKSYNNGQFVFRRNLGADEKFSSDTLSEINDNIDVFMRSALEYCHKDDIVIDVTFGYKVSTKAIEEYFFNRISAYVSGKEGLSFRYWKKLIGIDFNWKTDDVQNTISKIEDDLLVDGQKIVNIETYEDHKYKCNVHTSFVGQANIESKLRTKFTDIEVSNDNINHKLNIKLPYNNVKYYQTLLSSLSNELQTLKDAGCKIMFKRKPQGKILLLATENVDSRIAEIEEQIDDMRRADFGIEAGEKEVLFGKLLRVNYPHLTFDIDIKNENVESLVIDLFNDKQVDTIVPVLTGELEKISRLKKTFTQATLGEALENDNLQNFIFDSSKAVKTPDIEYYLRRDGSYYLEVKNNLLNKEIEGNDAQIDAIIKAINAKDLAVIQGPPGTGKSTAIAELIWQLVRNGEKQGNARERILLTSETNLAVDNAIARILNNKTNLVKPIRFGGEEKLEAEGIQFSLDLMKKWVAEGDSVLEIKDDEVDGEEAATSKKVNLVLKNWLNNISNRSFYGLPSEDNEIAARWRNFLTSPNEELRQSVFNRYVGGCNVIGATCSSIGDRKADQDNRFTSFFHNYCEITKPKSKKNERIQFSTVIQDESSKATPAELVLPFVYGKRAIVIGDHRQLPPMLTKEEFDITLDTAIKESITEEEKIEMENLRKFVDEHFDEMEISHFQKLYENIDNSLKGSFNKQYRMHPDINAVIEQFYIHDNGLKCGLIVPVDLGVNDKNFTRNKYSRYHGIEIEGLLTPDTHVLFIDSDTPEIKDGTSRVNNGEVEVVEKILSKFAESESYRNYLAKFKSEEEKEIGIISFYGKQIKKLRKVSRQYQDVVPTRVSTVDRFQGMERNIIIVSMVRSNSIAVEGQKPNFEKFPKWGYPKQESLGFAESPNRLNVALSRAKRLLVIIGNREHFSKLEIYRNLFSTIENLGNNNIIKINEL